MIDLMKYRWLFFSFSAVVIVPGLLSLLFFGLRLGVDFTGGSLLELQFSEPQQPVTEEGLRQDIGAAYTVTAIQPTGQDSYQIKGSPIDNGVKELVVADFKKKYGVVTVSRFETIGPILGQELVQKTFFAIGLAALGIALYLAHQFKEIKYGVCAVLAMFHDTLVLLGSFSLLGKFAGVEVDVLFVTAVLTTLSFSVHDTIVVFHRIGEFKGQHPRVPLATVINAAIWQTLSRSLNNSLTIIIMLLALVILGGDTIRTFALALLIGAVTGTYSSTFTAAPLLLVWETLAARRKRHVRI